MNRFDSIVSDTIEDHLQLGAIFMTSIKRRD